MRQSRLRYPLGSVFFAGPLLAAGECGPRRVFSETGSAGAGFCLATRFVAFDVFLAAGE